MMRSFFSATGCFRSATQWSFILTLLSCATGFGQGEKPGEKSAKKPVKVRVTVALPDEFRDADTNGDGQISFNEWRATHPKQISEFLQMDTDGDGFLTPKELVKAAKELKSREKDKPKTTASAPSPSSPTSTTPPTSPTTTTSPASGANKPAEPSKPAALSEQEELRGRAKNSFSMLDSDRNGSISPEEFSRSRTTRKLFEEAKIDMTKPMSQDDFIKNYLKASEK